MFTTIAYQIRSVTQVNEVNDYQTQVFRNFRNNSRIKLINQALRTVNPVFELIDYLIFPINQFRSAKNTYIDESHIKTLIYNNLHYFHVKQLRGNYELAIIANLSKKNVILTGQTGSGKTLCYQLSALIQTQFTMVVYPLVSVIFQQYHFINATASIGYRNAAKYDMATIMQLDTYSKLIYTTPQYVNKHRYVLKRFIRKGKFCRVVFDEGHGIGLDNDNYFRCFAFLSQYLPFTIITGSYSSTFRAQLERMCSHINELQCIELQDTLIPRQISFENKKFDHAGFALNREQPTIFLSLTIREADYLGQDLNIRSFHSYNTESLTDFLNGKITALSCTTAISQGLDSNASTIVIVEVPFSIEMMMYSIGRVGRRPPNIGRALVYFTDYGYLVNLCLITQTYEGFARDLCKYKLNCAYQACYHHGREMEYVAGYMKKNAREHNNEHCFCGYENCYLTYMNIYRAREIYERVYDAFSNDEYYQHSEGDDAELIVKMAAFDCIELIPPGNVLYGHIARDISTYYLKPSHFGFLLSDKQDSEDYEFEWTGTGLFA